MATQNFKTFDGLMKRIKDDVLRETAEQIVGTEPMELGWELQNEFTTEMLQEFEKFQSGRGFVASSKNAKYSRGWFASPELLGNQSSKGALGHFFEGLFGVGVNNSREPDIRNFRINNIEQGVEAKATLVMENRMRKSKRIRQSITSKSYDTGTTANDIRNSERVLDDTVATISKKMKYMLAANAYSYTTKQGVERWNYKDITLHMNVNPQKIKTFIQVGLIRIIQPDKEKYTYRFQIKDIDLFRYMYSSQVSFPTWQSAYKARKMGIIVHDKDDYRLKIHK